LKVIKIQVAVVTLQQRVESHQMSKMKLEQVRN